MRAGPASTRRTKGVRHGFDDDSEAANCRLRLRVMPKKALTATTFWHHVDVRGPHECWEWLRGRARFGHGKVMWEGRTAFTHRVAYALTHGIPVAAGKVTKDTLNVCHSCDNPPCCNPAHLFLGTQLANRQDCMAKGRAATGDRHGSRTKPERLARGENHRSRTKPETLVRGAAVWTAKLTEADIPVIRARRAAGESLKAIASDYGIGFTQVSKIALRKTWTHI